MMTERKRFKAPLPQRRIVLKRIEIRVTEYAEDNVVVDIDLPQDLGISKAVYMSPTHAVVRIKRPSDTETEEDAVE